MVLRSHTQARWRAALGLTIWLGASAVLVVLHGQQQALLSTIVDDLGGEPTGHRDGRTALAEAIFRQDLAFVTALGALAGLVLSMATLGGAAALQRRELGQVQAREREMTHLIWAVLQGTSDAVFVKDREGRYLFVNAAAAALAGKGVDDILGRDDTTIFDAEGARTVRQGDERAMASGAVQTTEERAKAGGIERVYLATKAPYRDEHGRVLGVIGISRDITDRKRDELALRAERDKIHTLLATSTSVLCAFRRSPDGKMTFPYASPHVVDLYGRTPEQLAEDGTPALALIHPEDVARITDAITRSEREGTLWNETFRIVHPHRGVVHLEGRSRPRREPDGSTVWDGVVTDVTERAALRDEVRAQHQMLRDAGELAKVGGWWIDLTTGEGRWTEQSAMIAGTTVGQASTVAEGIERFAAHGGVLAMAIARAASDGAPFDVELSRTLPDGTTQWVRAMGRPEVVDGRTVAIAGAIQDVTERRAIEERVRRFNVELEDRVRERTTQLEDANQELEAFGYSISHDLRAPLRSIQGFASVVLEDHGAALPPEAREPIESVVRSAQRMAQLIDSLLAFARMGRAPITRATVDHAAIVRSCLGELRPGPHVHLDVGPLPTTTGDPSLLRQVWLNLLSNALKYAAKRPQPTVEIRAEVTAEHGTVFSVRDDGAGFDMRYADKLFQVFSRLHASEEFQGTGVGLAIVQRIVKRHGGRVWAEAAPDRGAVFRFTVEQGTTTKVEAT